jgi:ABC-type transport system involved in Fe-S cluster assembly fused permease/ATPase subunit
MLFGTSIEENIRYGKPDAQMSDIEAAAKAANASDFVESFPDGYKTQVGDLGGKLSGGQKVRDNVRESPFQFGILSITPSLSLLRTATNCHC